MSILRNQIPIHADILSGLTDNKNSVLVFGDHKIKHCRIRPLETCGIAERTRALLGRMRYKILALAGLRHPDTRIPSQFMAEDFRSVLANYGFSNIKILDFFDKSADIVHDMNLPLPAQYEAAFETVIDMGTSEHVFDVRQCFANLFSLLKPGGTIILNLPCKGYYLHGLYTFSPELITEMLVCNGFEIIREIYGTEAGVIVDRNQDAPDIMMWMVARLTAKRDTFVSPQQAKWADVYRQQNG